MADPAGPPAPDHWRGPRSAASWALLLTLAAVAPALAQPVAPRPTIRLGPATAVAAGVDLYRPDARALLDPAGPITVRAVRLDPTRARLAIVLARDATPARQTVADIAREHRALVAINASFFDARGRQVGLAKVDAEQLKTNARARGAVAWSPGTTPVFDRVQSTIAVRPAESGVESVPVGFVNPTAVRLGLSLFTRSFALRVPGTTGTLMEPPGSTPDAAPPGSAPGAPADDPAASAPGVHVWRWLLKGPPWRVQQTVRDGQDHWATDGGTLLMWRGTTDAPPALRELRPGADVDLVETWSPRLGTPAAAWRDAAFAIAGAGLLMQGGGLIDDWSPEDLRPGFTTERHPRTVIGRDRRGHVWLVTVDGRHPKLSVGMSFTELQRLCAALDLTDALNLDGGGSTTMVVRDVIVNRPSDPGGARPVPDAIVVLPSRQK